VFPQRPDVVLLDLNMPAFPHQTLQAILKDAPAATL
jgi:hypothetical protein